MSPWIPSVKNKEPAKERGRDGTLCVELCVCLCVYRLVSDNSGLVSFVFD